MQRKLSIPSRNSSYSDISYWNARYKLEATYDWLLPYETYSNLLREHIKRPDRILMLGCGNSLLSELMYLDGYTNIENIDYSEVVIENMANHCNTCASMKWHVMDATKLHFADCTFDVVIEKATIDAMLVDEKDPWSVSEGGRTLVHTVLREVSRVLRPSGRFISMTFAQPHFRGPLYVNEALNWSLEVFNFGTSFHYFYYLLTKGEKPSQSKFSSYQLPVVRQRDSALRISCSSESENEDFLLRISDS